MVINKFPNREVYEKIKAKGSLSADDVNVLEDYPGLEWKGEYSSTATYVKGDIVYYENMLYVMVSASVIGAIPGIDNDWIDFAKRSVTNSDVTTALGFTPADSTKVLPLSGGTLTGNLTGKYIIGTWLQATDAGHLATTPTKIPVFDDKGWIYYRTPAEILKDIGASSGYTLTEADKTEIAGKVVADGTEFTLSDFPTALKNPHALTFTGAATGTYDGSEALTITIPEGGSGGSTGGTLKAMSAVGGYIGIPAAELPENGVVWMCFGSGSSTELYTGTVTIQDAGIAVNDMLVITNGTVNPLDQVAWVSDGLAIYSLSTSDYRGVYQVVGAGGAIPGTDLSLGVTGATVGQIAKITAVDASGKPTAWAPVDLPSGNEGKSWTKIIDVEITEATDSFLKNGLNNCTEIYAVWGGIQNATSTNSTLVLKINDVMVNNSFVLNQKSGSSVYGYSTAKYNGQVWLTMRSGGAILPENISPHSLSSPYNTVANVGKATKIKMTILNSMYAPVSGKLEVWAR